jgi:hypothetical protein
MYQLNTGRAKRLGIYVLLTLTGWLGGDPAVAVILASANPSVAALQQIFGYKPAPRLEHIDDEYCERKQQRKHRRDRAMILPGDATPKPDGIFGKDSRPQTMTLQDVGPRPAPA